MCDALTIFDAGAGQNQSCSIGIVNPSTRFGGRASPNRTIRQTGEAAIVKSAPAHIVLSNPDMLQPILSHYALRRPGTPEEVANMVLYLASDEAGWVTGGTFTIDGGMTVSKG